MGQAPLNRDDQIKFMKNASQRREASRERWSKSAMHQDALHEPAQHDAHTSQYSRQNILARRCA